MTDAKELIANRYERLRVLGVGGMGRVYLATDKKLDREVALKMVRTDSCADPELAQKRLMREGQNNSRLSHANIVRVYDVFEEEGLPWIAMEYVDGKSYRDLLDNNLPLEKSLEILRQVVEALVYAHNEGVVHRDLKPENILVAKDGTAKVSDWGLSRSDRDETGLTKTGLIVGTPEYLAPERILKAETTSASDIYALGCMLYEASEGQPPFRNKDIAYLLQSQLKSPPPSVCGRPAALQSLIDCLLAKDPLRRPKSSKQLVQRLSAIDLTLKDTVPVKALPKTKSRSPFAALLVSALCIFVFFFASQKQEGLPQEEKTVSFSQAEIQRQYYFMLAKGNSKAMSSFFERLLKRQMTPDDKKFAVQALKEGVGRKVAICAQALGQCYVRGELVELSAKKAFAMFKLASSWGNNEATTTMARCYESGRGVGRNRTKAFNLYSLAAKQGNKGAKVRLGVCYLYGVGTAKNKKRAIKIFEEEALEKNFYALHMLGQCYEKGHGKTVNMMRAMNYYKKAANNGIDEAAERLGKMYERGFPGLKRCPETSFHWYKRSYEMGNVGAWAKVARCYERGVGVKADPQKAIKMYKKLAKLNVKEAMLGLGRCYEKGIGVPQNPQKAFYYFQKGAKLGSYSCIERLAYCYDIGFGCIRNPLKAGKLRTKLGSSHVDEFLWSLEK